MLSDTINFMSIRTTAVALNDTTPTKLSNAENQSRPNPSIISMYNNSGATVYIGGDDVTVANGFPRPDGTSYDMPGTSGNDLYAIAATGTPSVRVLQSNQ